MIKREITNDKIIVWRNYNKFSNIISYLLLIIVPTEKSNEIDKEKYYQYMYSR